MPDESYQFWDFPLEDKQGWQELSGIFSDLKGAKDFIFILEVKPGDGSIAFNNIFLEEKGG